MSSCLGRNSSGTYTGKKVPGKFSDEKMTEIIKEVEALKPKMYSILTQVMVCSEANEDNHSSSC